MIKTIAAIALAVTVAIAADEPASGPVWRGNDLDAWQHGANQMRETALADGVLTGKPAGPDSFFSGNVKPFAASPAQELVFRAKSPVEGKGEIFWTTTKMKGPDQKHSAAFKWIGDGEWHEYRVRPFWHGEGDIRCVRIDFPANAANAGECALSEVRVETAVTQKPISLSNALGVRFVVDGDTPATGLFAWAADNAPGSHFRKFSVPGDGRAHTISLDMAGENGRDVNIVWWEFTNSRTGEPLETKDFRTFSDDGDIPADLIVKSARAAEAIPRTGQPIPVELVVENLGGAPAENASISVPALPDGISGGGRSAARTVADGETATFSVEIRAVRPGNYEIPVELKADGIAPVTTKVVLKAAPSLDLVKASYVPEPKPVRTTYDIAALYFPGWNTYRSWERVRNTCPERKPVLGWYDEANPEIVDWQIKWLVENGICTLYVDWYWSAGSQHLDHWVKAFYRAKYRNRMKWAMMWANHNAPGTHSEADQRAVTKFWIENYFNTPEYLQIDGMPVVWIWSPENIERDMAGNGGCRRLLEVSREMARAAGFRGIWFISMKWPEAVCTPEVVSRIRDLGFDMTSIYHFMDHGGRSNTYRRFPYSQVAEANVENWRALERTGILPYLPNLSTGWDDRPWNDHCEIYGKNAADFRSICQAAKRFADETGVKRLCIAPLNEWGEGSYAEPNSEHGFGFYEAVRETFCEKPAAGWPQNYGPKDVGLGPYDIPPPPPQEKKTSWSCKDGEPKGWNAFMGLSSARSTGEGVAYSTTSRDPAVSVSAQRIRAKEFGTVIVRMRTRDAAGTLQLFWGGSAGPISEKSSMHREIIADGKWHDYRFPVSGHKAWRGRIDSIRIDPGSEIGAEVEFAELRLVQ
ncbi:MAG: glycoside hydrolase family 99-like domain-containing protein [Kiritimatiellae bacterium]|nr:glycoside hydrolase family 99-like domain-containing protein [Kiritimatiellia bacterium]